MIQLALIVAAGSLFAGLLLAFGTALRQPARA